MSLLTKRYPIRELEAQSDWPHLVRWNPFREMEQMRQHLESFFGGPVLGGNGRREEAMTSTQWTPLVDITEDDKEYLIKAELPELKKEDVKVTVENGVLTLSGERNLEAEEKGRKYHRVERAYGSFIRCFSLPEEAEPGKINAEFKDGVLKVHIAKSEKTKGKGTEVKVA